MSFQDQHILLTGAAGGIGHHLAKQWAAAGARLTLTDRDSAALEAVAQGIEAERCLLVSADITSAAGRQNLIEQARARFGTIDRLIHAAGIAPFGVFVEQSPELLERTMQINVTAPMLLTQLVLPQMLKQGGGHVVMIGSTFGSIGFAWYSAYSASKFALRGFAQALRRELAGTSIAISYIAPRAVKTPINSAAVYAMAQAMKMSMDEPDAVASQIIAAVKRGRKECYIGFPESWFARINALLPGWVDRAVEKQNRISRKFAQQSMNS